jgi:hypothetical protein
MTGVEIPEGVRDSRLGCNQDGITEVKSVSEMLPDGSMKTSSQYLQTGNLVDGHSAIYRLDPSAVLRLDDPIADAPISSN